MPEPFVNLGAVVWGRGALQSELITSDFDGGAMQTSVRDADGTEHVSVHTFERGDCLGAHASGTVSPQALRWGLRSTGGGGQLRVCGQERRA